MASAEYIKARKLAKKAYKKDIEEGKYPYLKVLDEFLPFVKVVGEADLGLVEIPIKLIAGTKTAGRTKAFADNFMPLLDESTEFADKWSSLYRSHIEEGIREPVIACEFMNSYYIIEGNKRVSVLKYSGAVSISGYVTRIIPEADDSKESVIYYEFMDFNRVSGINNIYFSKPGGFKKLCSLVGKDPSNRWSEDERKLFSSCFFRFEKAFTDEGGSELAITSGDALLLYLELYSYKSLTDKTPSDIQKELSSMWPEFEAYFEDGDVNLVMQPEKEPEKSFVEKNLIEKNFLTRLIFPSEKKLKVGFIYYKTAESSDWTYGHDLGRLYLEDTMGSQLDIKVYDGAVTEEDSLELMDKAIADGCTVLFTASPRFLGSSIKAGIKYPDIKILNCSLNAYSGHLRTYYGRLYEAKFLVGMLAGILSSTDHIGYISDFPIFGSTASINAFALGVKMVNPGATVHLVWSTEKGTDINKIFSEANVSHISGRDMVAPLHSTRKYGLYDLSRPESGSIATCIWHWGKFYHRIIQTILNGNWKRTLSDGQSESVNYWWGISSGMIDMIASSSVPKRTMSLIELVKKQIISGEFNIFSGDIRDQAGNIITRGNESLSPKQIVEMDRLCDNIEGHIPHITDLYDEAIPMVRIQGIYSDREGFQL